MAVVKIIAFTMIFILGLTFFILQRNEANLFEGPGVHQRLTTYLSTNVAETSDDHPFAELRTPVFNVEAKKLYERVLFVAAESGWNVLAHDSDNLSANFVVRTPVFLFEDDVFVQVQFINMDESLQNKTVMALNEAKGAIQSNDELELAKSESALKRLKAELEKLKT